MVGVGCWVVGVNDMPCCPRETSPRSFHARRPYPRSLTVVVACFAAPPRPFDDLGSFMVEAAAKLPLLKNGVYICMVWYGLYCPRKRLDQLKKIKALIDFWSVQDRNMGLYGLARGSVWQQNSLLAVLFH